MMLQTRRIPSLPGSSASRWGWCRLQAWHKKGKCGSHGSSWVIVIYKCKGRFILCCLGALLINSESYLVRSCLIHCYPPAASVPSLSSEENVRWFGSWWKRSYWKMSYHLCLNCLLWDRNTYTDSQHRAIHRLLFHTNLISLYFFYLSGSTETVLLKVNRMLVLKASCLQHFWKFSHEQCYSGPVDLLQILLKCGDAWKFWKYLDNNGYETPFLLTAGTSQTPFLFRFFKKFYSRRTLAYHKPCFARNSARNRAEVSSFASSIFLLWWKMISQHAFMGLILVILLINTQIPFLLRAICFLTYCNNLSVCFLPIGA